jgi:hypothetical protein
MYNAVTFQSNVADLWYQTLLDLIQLGIGQLRTNFRVVWCPTKPDPAG